MCKIGNQLTIWVLMLLGEIERLLFKPSAKRWHTIKALYRFLMYMSAASVVLTFLEILPTTAWGASDWAKFVFGFATAIQYTIIYKNIENIEEGTVSYPNWTGSDLEKVLRFFIMLFLLFGVGKVAIILAPLFGKALTYWNLDETHAPLTGGLKELFTKQNLATSGSSILLFASGSACSFFFLANWNVFALLRRRYGTSYSGFTRPHSDWKAGLRIFFYMFSAVTAFAYWVLFLTLPESSAQIAAMMLIAIYLFSFFIALIPNFLEWFET